MAYRIGIEVGSEQTSWATIGRDGSGPERVDGGVIESVVGLVDGEVVVGEDAADPGSVQEVTRGFVQRLGESEAVMLGGTPYGVEALIGRLIAAAVRKATQQLGSAPGGVVIVHDDGLDEFRVGLLTEAARLAGIPVADVVMVSRSESLAVSPETGAPAASAGSQAAGGAARLGWTLHPGPIAAAAGSVGATELGIAAAGAGGAAVAATALGEGMASASAVLTPTAGAGPAGTPLSAPAGAGPTGSPLSAPAGAGPSGSPLTPPAGPAGTPLTPPAGPTGSPLEPVPTPGHSGIPGVLKRPRKIPMIIGAGVAAVAVATTIVLATNDDDSSSTSPSTTVVAEPGVTVPTSITDATADTTIPAVVPNAAVCVQGEWTMRNDTFAEFFASNIAAAGEGEIIATGVSGSVMIDVAPDGTWTITYIAWSVSASMPSVGAEVSIVIDGTDVSMGTFNDDGTYGFSGVSEGTTMSFNATMNGMDFPMPPLDRSTQVIDGSGSFTCAGDELMLTVSSSAGGGSFIMDRTG